MKIEKCIPNLINKINKLNYYYYILNKSIISDIKYNNLIKKLYYLEKKYPKYLKKNSLTKVVYYKHDKNSTKFNHLSKMLSLKSIYEYNNLFLFDKIIKKKTNSKKIDYFCEIKIDGIASNLIYKNGELFKILTRGDGYTGEDITSKFEYIKNIPKKLNNYINKNKLDLLEIRGELCILKNDFLNLNRNLLKINNKKFINQRNSIFGILKNKNYNILYKNKIHFVSHGIGINNFINNKKFIKKNSYSELMNKIKDYGFDIIYNNKICNSINNVINFCKNIYDNKKSLKYFIDGIVIKVNKIKNQNILGISKKYPNWSIAYKSNSEVKETKLIKIEYKIGKTGLITPIAIIKEINFFNVKVNKIYLQNFKKIFLLNIFTEDTILVKMSGNIIPTIYKPLIKYRNNKNKRIKIIRFCPSCNSILKINFKKLKCDYIYCKEKIKKKIIHFFSKDSIYIKSINKNIITKLVDNNLIKSYLDIFKLNNKNINKIINYNNINKINIELKNKINVRLYNLIYSLNINKIGKNTSKIISNKIKKIDYFLNENFNFKDLNFLDKDKAYNLIIFFKNKNNKNNILELLKYINIY